MYLQNKPFQSEREILSSRIFNVNRITLFRAWSDAEHLKNWWGPKGFTNTFEEFDFRAGGKWKFVMHGPEKGNHANECEFTEIIVPRLIRWKRYSKPLFEVHVTFEEISENETSLHFKMLFPTKAECDKVKPFAVDKNEENFDKLEIELKKMLS